MYNIKKISQAFLEILLNEPKLVPKLTFDLLPPANQNFRGYDI